MPNLPGRVQRNGNRRRRRKKTSLKQVSPETNPKINCASTHVSSYYIMWKWINLFTKKINNNNKNKIHISKKSHISIMALDFPGIQGFSQDFEIGCPKIVLLCILCNNRVSSSYLFYSKFRNFGVSKIIIGCPKDRWMGLWLKPCWYIITPFI